MDSSSHLPPVAEIGGIAPGAATVEGTLDDAREAARKFQEEREKAQPAQSLLSAYDELRAYVERQGSFPFSAEKVLKQAGRADIEEVLEMGSVMSARLCLQLMMRCDLQLARELVEFTYTVADVKRFSPSDTALVSLRRFQDQLAILLRLADSRSKQVRRAELAKRGGGGKGESDD